MKHSRMNRPSPRMLPPCVAIAFLCTMAGSVVAQPASPRTPAGNALAGRIRQLFKEGKVEKALAVAADRRKAVPDDVGVRWHFIQAHLSVSRHLIRSLQYARAEQLLGTVLEAVPTETAAGRMLLAIREARKQAPVRVADARQMVRLELYEQALRIFERAAALLPADAPKWQSDWRRCLRGVADDYYRSKLLARAFPWYQRAMDAAEGRDAELQRRWAHCLIRFAADASSKEKLSKQAWLLLLRQAMPVLHNLGDQILADVLRGLVTQNLGQFEEAAESYATVTGKKVDPKNFRSVAALNPLRDEALKVIDDQVQDIGPTLRSRRWRSTLPGGWIVRQGERVSILHHNDYAAKRVREAVEFHLPRIVAAWGGTMETLDWPKKLQIEIYADKKTMLEAIKQPSITGGASRIRFRVSTRELLSHTIYCVQIDPKLLDSVIPHELTHAVLSAMTKRVAMPLAISEGISILSEPPYRWAYYRNGLRKARKAGGLFPLRQLLAFRQDQFPPLPRAGVFYAQSHAFVRFLLGRAGRAKLLGVIRRFEADRAADQLAAAYGWKSFAEMEAAWLDFIRAGHSKTPS